MDAKFLDLMAGIKVDIAEIKRDIAHHIKRTDLAEENIGLLRDDLKPLKRHVVLMQGAFALLTFASALASALKLFNIL